MTFWIPVATGAVAAGIVISVEILTIRRKRNSSRRQATSIFRSALADAIAHANGVDAHALLNEGRVHHDAALDGFRPFVRVERLNQFDTAVQKFHRGRSELIPAPVKVLASWSSGRPVDQSDALTLREALDELQAFAGSD